MRAKTHYFFDAKTVVPTPVEENKFARYGQMSSVTLKIPFTFLPVGRFAQSHHFCFPGAEVFDNSLYRSVFAGCISSFQYHKEFEIGRNNFLLQLDQLNKKFV